MYYEERIIDGVLCWRNTPTGHWAEVTSEELTEKIAELEQERGELKQVNRHLAHELSESTDILLGGSMCPHCLDRIQALHDTVATLYSELEHRQKVIGQLQTVNNTLRRRIAEAIERYNTEDA